MTAAILVLALLSLAAPAGASLMQAGMGRARSTSHALLLPLLAICSGAVLLAAGVAHWSGVSGASAQMLQGAALLWALVVPTGICMDRGRLLTTVLASLAVAGIFLPLTWRMEWVWLPGLCKQAGLGATPVDWAGSGYLHVAAGCVALALAWVLRPRRGKFNSQRQPTAIPGHNASYVLFGCWLVLIGAISLNAAAAMVAAPNTVSGLQLYGVAADCLLAAAGGFLSALYATHVRFRKPDVTLAANGFVAGLIACSAGSLAMPPSLALVTGLVAGLLVVWTAELLEVRAVVDDPAGTISMHLGAGLWGLLATGLFVRPQPGLPVSPGLVFGMAGQFWAQLVVVTTLAGVLVPTAFLLFALLGKLLPLRLESERQGADSQQFGGGAYPEFVLHAEEFTLE